LHRSVIIINRIDLVKKRRVDVLDLKQQEQIRTSALDYFDKAGIALSKDERSREIKIFNYDTVDFYEMGIVIVTFINTKRYCGRFILFFPGQSAGEHWHPDVGVNKGKEETLRVLYGQAFAYGEGEPTKNMKAKIPEGREKYFTSRHETILNPGDQYTVGLNEKHWWQAGPEGVITLEVSSTARDKYDLYTDNTLKVNIY
jgi:D-lyxose ketol-isomerase